MAALYLGCAPLATHILTTHIHATHSQTHTGAKCLLLCVCVYERESVSNVHQYPDEEEQYVQVPPLLLTPPIRLQVRA